MGKMTEAATCPSCYAVTGVFLSTGMCPVCEDHSAAEAEYDNAQAERELSENALVFQTAAF